MMNSKPFILFSFGCYCLLQWSTQFLIFVSTQVSFHLYQHDILRPILPLNYSYFSESGLRNVERSVSQFNICILYFHFVIHQLSVPIHQSHFFLNLSLMNFEFSFVSFTVLKYRSCFIQSWCVFKHLKNCTSCLFWCLYYSL